MLLFKKVADLQRYLGSIRSQGRQIGFAPTMGALHDGHGSLIRLSKNDNDCTVCSIFVNPTQFNDPKDLEKYPRTPGKDLEMLADTGADVLFMPPVEEIYPPGLDLRLRLDFGPLAKVMEGAFRPGHFDGMAQVVNRLLDIVRPDRLYMGQKDFQQYSIVANMLEQLHSPVQLVMAPTVREPDGLAMSSRNVRLTPENRQQATLLYQTLCNARDNMGRQTPATICHNALEKLAAVPEFRPEYFEIVNGKTLQPVSLFNDAEFVVACTAVWVGEVRLIDNLVLKGG